MEQPKEVKRNSENEDDLFDSDKIRLLHHLPAEIWQQVILRQTQHLKSETLESVSNSSPFFRNLFDSQKTTFLFGKVVMILVKDEYIHEFDDILNCRRVCKVWNEDIDRLLTKKHCKLYSNTEPNQFESYDKLVEFLNHFESTHPNNLRSPFIGDKVNLEVNEEYVFRGPNIREINQLKLNVIATMLQRYGKHIKIFTIIFNLDENLLLKNVLLKLRDWLLNTENLTKLSVINRKTYWDRMDAINGNLFLSQSFPKLNKLEALHINQCIPEDVGLNLIKNNNHIRKLFIEKNWRSGFNHDYKISTCYNLSNLVYLDISLNSIGKIENLSSLNFPHLSTLTLTAKREFYFDKQTRWSEIFPIIETKFGNTLKRLSVEMESHDSQVLNDTRKIKLNLPKLNELRLLINGPPVSLDFILSIKDSLERICVMANRSQNLEGDILKMTYFQKNWVTNSPYFSELIHFDTSFEEIRDWVKRATISFESNGMIVSDKLLLR